MLSNVEIMMGVVHEAEVRQATAYGEHRFTARVLARSGARPARSNAGDWKVWSRLGAARLEKKTSK